MWSPCCAWCPGLAYCSPGVCPLTPLPAHHSWWFHWPGPAWLQGKPLLQLGLALEVVARWWLSVCPLLLPLILWVQVGGTLPHSPHWPQCSQKAAVTVGTLWPFFLSSSLTSFLSHRVAASSSEALVSFVHVPVDYAWSQAKTWATCRGT